MKDHAQRVLRRVAEPGYHPQTVRGLGRQLGIGPAEYAAFRRTVKDLLHAGDLECGRDKRIRLTGVRHDVVGTFRRAQGGFGFVRPEGTSDRADQIYVALEHAGDAASGDTVAVAVHAPPRPPDRNAAGRIVRIVARAAARFVGSYFEQDGTAFVRLDGTAFSAPIPVGDPGAKGARSGDKVVLELAAYPSPLSPGQGVITEILGRRGQPGVDTLAILRGYGIPDEFDPRALDEAREQARQFDEAAVADRLDLRDQLTVTIDPATARDFDDAITLTRDDRGYWSLGVHIADVAHFVPLGSALDHEARKRGTSVYLPDKVVPMLPEVISNGLASLQAGRTRYTMSALLEFNAEGVCTAQQFARSVIRVDQRFAYEEAMAVIAGAERPAAVPPAICAMLGEMRDLARLLRHRRFARGALELNMPEVEIDLGDDGQVVGAHVASHDESHQVIEEFMLAANEAVATFLAGRNVPFLRRAHPDPELGKLREFADFARSLGFPLVNPESRFELQRLLRATADRPEAAAVHYGLLRSLKQAAYTPEAEGHYALASDRYCHFTSPIRRYPDLQVHRQLALVLAGKPARGNRDALAELGAHCTRTERRAEQAERELTKIKLLGYLESRVGETFAATIIGVEDFGFFCRLADVPAEGLVAVRTLTEDHHYLEAATRTLVARRSGRRYRLGDPVQVRIRAVDVDRRTLDLELVVEAATAPPPPHRPRGKRQP